MSAFVHVSSLMLASKMCSCKTSKALLLAISGCINIEFSSCILCKKTLSQRVIFLLLSSCPIKINMIIHLRPFLYPSNISIITFGTVIFYLFGQRINYLHIYFSDKVVSI